MHASACCTGIQDPNHVELGFHPTLSMQASPLRCNKWVWYRTSFSQWQDDDSGPWRRFLIVLVAHTDVTFDNSEAIAYILVGDLAPASQRSPHGVHGAKLITDLPQPPTCATPIFQHLH